MKDVVALDPSNTSLADYVSNFALDNNATQPEINDAIALLQTGSYNFSPTELAQVDTALANINPELPTLYTNAGILTDPDYLTYVTNPDSVTSSTGALESVYGSYNPLAVPGDLVTLFNDSVSTPVDPTLSADLNTLVADFSFPGDPSALAGLLGDSAAATAAGAGAPTGLTADLSTLLAGLGAGVGSEALSQMLTDFSSQFAADFAPQVATDLATLIPSMF